MAFLLGTRIRAHGTTNSRILRCVCHRPFSFIRTLTVGFGVAPNLLTLPFRTKSFSGQKSLGKALAGLGLSALTAGGDFHPALRTSAVRDERPERKYDAGPGPQQACSAWRMRMVPCRFGGPAPHGTELTIGWSDDSDLSR